MTLNSFRIEHLLVDQLNQVSFNMNATDSMVAELFELEFNQTHILFNKKSLPSLSTNKTAKFSITVELNSSTGVSAQSFEGQVYFVELKQLKRIVQLSGSRLNAASLKGLLQRSKLVNTTISLSSLLLASNPLPVGVHLNLVSNLGTHVEAVEYVGLEPARLKPATHSVDGFSHLPVEVVLYLAKSLQVNQTQGWTSLSFNLKATARSSDYLNTILSSLEGVDINLEIEFENNHAPMIVDVSPLNGVISLDEGVYVNKIIGSIKAVDLDKGEPGRLEYFLIGSTLLEINKTTGEIFISGSLNAENEQTVKFYCYARDMAPMALSKQSEMIEFNLNVNDLNEFTPSIQPTLVFLTLNENDQSLVFPNVIDNTEITCFDRDQTADVKLNLVSVR